MIRPTIVRPVVELVFVLDTTGSMSGLIQGAKDRVWGIVNEVLKGARGPQVRVGLVGYRDRGDAYVTKITPLTSDLDKVYADLMGYQADGGGDGPEDVRTALVHGLEKVEWKKREPGTAQILFLVGDAPPHDDYDNVPPCMKTVGNAVARGIIVNTIQCGSMPGTAEVWQQLARAGEGEFFAIAQDGGVALIATPYDKKLAELGGQIGSTYVVFGGGGGAAGMSYRAAEASKQSEYEDSFKTRASVSALADRAGNKALNSTAYRTNDLVQQVMSGTIKVESVKKEDLPDELLGKLGAGQRRSPEPPMQLATQPFSPATGTSP